MGTFKITLATTSSAAPFTASQVVFDDTWWYAIAAVPPNPMVLQGFVAALAVDDGYTDYAAIQPIAVLNYLLRFNTSGANNISLDGDPPIGFASLPAGFTVLTASIICRCAVGGAGWTMFLQQSALIEDAGTVLIAGDQIVTFPFDMVTPPIPTMLDVVNNGCGIRLVAPSGDSINVDYLWITGTYELQFFQYSIDPTSGSEVDIGETIRLTSPGINPATDLDFTHLTISIDSTLPTCDGPITPIIQTQQELVFTIPLGCSTTVGAGTITIVATGDGTQFSGSVDLGVLEVVLANASGIYTLVPGKSNDTLYSGARDGATYGIKIPNPFAKTGFIGG